MSMINRDLFPELSHVRTLRRCGKVPAGVVGIIVQTHRTWSSYEVEFVIGDTFVNHSHRVEMIDATDVELVS